MSEDRGFTPHSIKQKEDHMKRPKQPGEYAAHEMIIRDFIFGLITVEHDADHSEYVPTDRND